MKFSDDISKLLKRLSDQPEAVWLESGKRMAEELFDSMRQRVPAYGSLLNEQGWQAGDEWPVVDKDSYLRRYSLNELAWDGELAEQHQVISATSGSTGEPFYFPRQEEQDEVYALTAELYLRSNFAIDKRRTLYIVAFPMGVWIGGVFTYEALTKVARKGNYALSVLTAGISKEEVVKAVQRLGGHYDQILIGSYAPFLREIVEYGEQQGLDWSEHRLGFVYSAEGFSEEFRAYIYQKTGVKDYFRGSLNHYGTVDLGTMAHETPLTILIRQLALDNTELMAELFEGNTEHMPTLCQYVPELFYFEKIAGQLVCSSRSGLPLLRYNLKDRGGLLGFEEMKRLMAKHGIDLQAEIEKRGLADTVWQLPLVYVYERDDFSVSFYSFQLYPETVKRGLLEASIRDKVTGKFTMQVVHDKEHRQQLQIFVELASGVEESQGLQGEVEEALLQGLRQYSSEFAKVYQEFGQQVAPIVDLRARGDAEYFSGGGKHTWTLR